MIDFNAFNLSPRDPDVLIRGREKEPYMDRWWFRRTKESSVYLHKFLASDPGRDPHTHPWESCSVLLKGEYVERFFEIRNGERVLVNELLRKAGDVVFRSIDVIHEIKLVDNKPCWSLFITGAVKNQWGFYLMDGTFVGWRDYIDW